MPEESHCAAASSAPLRGLPGATSRPRRLTGPTESDVHPEGGGARQMKRGAAAGASGAAGSEGLEAGNDTVIDDPEANEHSSHQSDVHPEGGKCAGRLDPLTTAGAPARRPPVRAIRYDNGRTGRRVPAARGVRTPSGGRTGRTPARGR